MGRKHECRFWMILKLHSAHLALLSNIYMQVQRVDVESITFIVTDVTSYAHAQPKALLCSSDDANSIAVTYALASNSAHLNRLSSLDV